MSSLGWMSKLVTWALVPLRSTPDAVQRKALGDETEKRFSPAPSTHRRARVLAEGKPLRRGVSLALILGLTMILGGSDPAEAEISLQFVPSSVPVTVGAPVTLAIQISGLGAGAAPSLGAFDINVNFDPAILEFSDVNYEDPILGNQLDLFGLGSSTTTTPGVGVVNLFELSLDSPADLNASQAGTFILARVTFNTLATGASPLSLTVNALGDASGNPLTAVVGSGSISVEGRLFSALSPAKVWVGLKNSDDVGTSFDLLAEVFLNTTKVGEGQLNNVPGGGSGFNNAGLYTIPLTLFAPVNVSGNAALKLKLSVRVAANSRHRSGAARLWYNGRPLGSGKKGEKRDAGSRFDATIAGATADYFLRENSVLSTAPGSAMKFIDVGVDRARNGNPFKPFGVWSLTLP